MRRVLSIDPGLTTGIAIYDENGKLEAAVTASKDTIYVDGWLNKLVALAQPEVVLIEAIPISQLVEIDMIDLYAYLKEWLKRTDLEIEIITPSQWKKLIERVEIPGQHARDAATMGAWWIKREKIREES